MVGVFHGDSEKATKRWVHMGAQGCTQRTLGEWMVLATGVEFTIHRFWAIQAQALLGNDVFFLQRFGPLSFLWNVISSPIKSTQSSVVIPTNNPQSVPTSIPDLKCKPHPTLMDKPSSSSWLYLIISPGGTIWFALGKPSDSWGGSQRYLHGGRHVRS